MNISFEVGICIKLGSSFVKAIEISSMDFHPLYLITIALFKKHRNNILVYQFLSVLVIKIV